MASRGISEMLCDGVSGDQTEVVFYLWIEVRFLSSSGLRLYRALSANADAKRTRPPMRNAMLSAHKSKNHHWWPVALQSHWTNKKGDISWVEPDGKIFRKRAANRKVGFKIHGHTVFRGSVWESNFEAEFDIDNQVHAIISGLRKLKPLGSKPSEFVGLAKLLFKKNRVLRDMCKFYDLDEKLHRDLLLFMMSLLIRSPASRSRFESYPETIGLPPNEEVGKMNMLQNYRAAKKLCRNGFTSNQYFVLLHSPLKKFNFGDGTLDWLSGGLIGSRISGRTLLPLTPNLCVYFCTPMMMRSSPNCASLSAPPWMVDWVNDLTQIYSKQRLFFVGRAPKTTEAFRQGQFLQHKERTDALIEMLDEIAGIKKREGIIAFTAFS